MLLSINKNAAFKTLLLLSDFTQAVYSPSSKSNVVVYWGQQGNTRLVHFCETPAIDIVLLSFMNLFPGQAQGPGTNFAGNCNVDPYPGTRLLKPCPPLPEDIQTCQTMGKKVILALGGERGYELTGVAKGEEFADWLWGAFGPMSANNGQQRPFGSSEIDGFDFDIETPSTDEQAGYIAMINRLRSHFAGAAAKEYLITGAPQCTIPETHMGEMIKHAKFDMLLIQFYNTPCCSARNFIDSGVVMPINQWANFISGTASSNATLYIGLPGDRPAANPGYYINETELEKVIMAHAGNPKFGGIMIWDATRAEENIESGKPFYVVAKEILNRARGGAIRISMKRAFGIAAVSSQMTSTVSPNTTITASAASKNGSVSQNGSAAVAIALAAITFGYLYLF